MILLATAEGRVEKFQILNTIGSVAAVSKVSYWRRLIFCRCHAGRLIFSALISGDGGSAVWFAAAVVNYKSSVIYWKSN